jgi:hypothetical protein
VVLLKPANLLSHRRHGAGRLLAMVCRINMDSTALRFEHTFVSKEFRMKKIVWFVIGVFLLFLMGCDDVLTVVTVNENGEKVIHSYISLMGDTVYDSTVSLKNWRDIDDFSSDDLLFTIVNNKENIVVLGDAEAAIEISFFDGGYKYTVFMSADGLSEAFNW